MLPIKKWQRQNIVTGKKLDELMKGKNPPQESLFYYRVSKSRV